MDTATKIRDEINLTSKLLAGIALDDALVQTIEAVAQQFVACLLAGGKVLWCGNGGSAADAQHLAAEFVVRFTVDRPALASLALTVDTSTLTACANDYGYDHVFGRQVMALGNAGDILVGISTSGNSTSVVNAMLAAKGKGLVTIGMTGSTGGKMADICDAMLRVPSDRTQNIQEAHILFGHILVGRMEQTLFPEKFV